MQQLEFLFEPGNMTTLVRSVNTALAPGPALAIGYSYIPYMAVHG